MNAFQTFIASGFNATDVSDIRDVWILRMNLNQAKCFNGKEILK